MPLGVGGLEDDVAVRVALVDAVVDRALPVGPMQQQPVHANVLRLAGAVHTADGLLLVGRGVDALGVCARGVARGVEGEM